MMAKNKSEIPDPTNVTNRDILQRLNFLYQASVLLNGLAPSDRDDDDASTPKTKKKKRRVVRCDELARSYVETMKSVGQKTNVRMDPSVKRRICKRCCAPLIPGISATVRIRDSPSHGHLIAYGCHGCQEERCIPAPPVLQPDDPEYAMQTEASTSAARRLKNKKKGPRPRLPPHFARDAGHVVFRGNERLDKVPSVS